MERGSNYTNRISKVKRILDWFIEELGKNDQSNGNSQRNNEKAV